MTLKKKILGFLKIIRTLMLIFDKKTKSHRNKIRKS